QQTTHACAATPRQFRDPGRSLSWVCRSHARDERPRHETQVGMVDAFAACLNLLDGHLSDTSLLCPPNRVKLTIVTRCGKAFLSSTATVRRGSTPGWRLPAGEGIVSWTISCVPRHPAGVSGRGSREVHRAL